MPKEECARKIALLEDVRTSISELIAIHSEEVAALLRDDFAGFAALEAKIQMARNNKALIAELYREHVISHGC